MDDKKYAQIQYDAENLENVQIRELAGLQKYEAVPQNIFTEHSTVPQGKPCGTVQNTTDMENKKILMISEERVNSYQEEISNIDQGKVSNAGTEETDGYTEEAKAEGCAKGNKEEQIVRIEEQIESIYGIMRRLEKKFETEILNSETRDGTVKSIYKELNEYKAGLVEKALKNVLYDFIDIREMMLAKLRNLEEKGDTDVIPLEEFEFYIDSIGDILEKHDVAIYRGKPGIENVAVRQKIVKKTETEDETMIKKVAESLSYGYEYNGKVIYPEKINIYVKKK